MAGYTELLEGYDFVQEENSVASGVRTFYKDASGTDSLPSIGDVFPTPGSGDVTVPSNCKARSINLKKWTINTSGDVYRYVVNYSTPQSSGGTNTPLPNDGDETLRIGVEAFLLENDGNGNGLAWNSGGGLAVNVQFVKQIAVATYSISENFSTFAGAIASVTGKVGLVDATTQQWLLVGADIDEHSDGYRCVRRYSFRRPSPDEVGPIYYGWNHIWDQRRGVWDKTFPLTYETTTFTDTLPSL